VIEPNKLLADNYKKARPKDIVLNIGVHFADNDVNELPFYQFVDATGVNSFSIEDADKVIQRLRGVKPYKIITTKIKKVNDIILCNFDGIAPTFISVDCKGIYVVIIKSIDFDKYRPALLCAETAEPCLNGHLERKDSEITNYMLSKDYVFYADTYVNTIFIDKVVLEKIY
jgi:hypothetical protein